jgi:hypothetical protein
MPPARTGGRPVDARDELVHLHDRWPARRYRGRVSPIPWWAIPLIAAVFALAGAAAAQLVTIRNERGRARAATAHRWYEERMSAYAGLLAAFERSITRLKVGFAAGVTDPDPMTYLDEVGPALMQVRLLASGPVRSAALAVHRLLEDMHGHRPPPAPGQGPAPHFLEVLAHVPLVMHEFEVAVRDELGINASPPPTPPPAGPLWRRRTRSPLARARQPQSAPPSSTATTAGPDPR